jgi:hypothetical protein
MVVSVSEEIAVGAEVEFLIEIEKTDFDLPNLALILEPGDGFNKTGSEPASDENELYQWSLDLSDNQQIKIRGMFNSDDSGDEAVVHFQLAGWKTEDKTEEPSIKDKNYAEEQAVANIEAKFAQYKPMLTLDEKGIELEFTGSEEDFEGLKSFVKSSGFPNANIFKGVGLLGE